MQCVGFSFDGASVMSGPKGGVQAILKKYYQNAIFVHCHSHRLNLVLQEVSSLCTEVGDCLAMCNKLSVFFSHPKRLSLLKQKQAEYRPDKQPVGLTNAGDTRWSSYAVSVTKVTLLLESIFAALEDLSEMMQARVEAEGILHLMRCKKFIFVLFMLSKVLDSCEITTKALQAPSQTIGDVSDHVFALKDTLKLFHSEEHFQSVLALSIQVCTAYEIELYDSCSKRVKRTPQRLVDTHITSTTGQRRRVSCDEDLQLIYYEAIDIIMGELDLLFHPEALDLYNVSRQITQMQDFSGANFAIRVGLSISDSEQMLFQGLCKRKLPESSDLMMYLDICNPDIFPSVYQLLTSILVCPISSVSVERLFSTLKRIHAPNRRSMGTERLNQLCFLSLETDLTRRMQTAPGLVVTALKKLYSS